MRSGLTLRLLLLVVPLVVAPFAALSGWAFVKLRDAELLRSTEALQMSVSRLAGDARGRIDDARRNLEFFSRTSLVRNYAGTTDERMRYQLLQPSLIDFLKEVRVAFPQYEDVRLLDAEGTDDTRVAKNDAAEFALPFGLWRDTVAAQGGDVRLVKGADDGETRLWLAQRIEAVDPSPDPRRGPRTVTGFLLTSHALDFLQQLVAGSSTSLLADLHFVDREGVVLASSRPASRGQILALSDTRKDGPDGGRASTRLVKEVMPGLWLVGELTSSRLGQALRGIFWSVAAVSAIAIVLSMGLLALAMRRSLLAPIAALQLATEAIGHERPVASLPTSRSDELGALARALAHMREMLAERRAALASQNAELETRSVELERARDAALAADRTKTNFLALMSHELRTPLSGVLGMSEILLDGELDEVQRLQVQTVQQCGKSLLGLIDDLLSFAEVEAGRLELQLDPMDPVATAAQVVESFRLLAESKHLGLHLHADPRCHAPVLGDAFRLQQVLAKLLDNAVKFTMTGEVVVGISRERPGFLRFEIRDTGPGLPAERHATAFEPFWQGDAGATRRFGGIGLGLSLARKLTEAMGGTLQLASGAEGGTVALLELPLTEPPSAGRG